MEIIKKHIGKILCFFGIHKYEYYVIEHKYTESYMKECERCNKRYKYCWYLDFWWLCHK